MFIGLKTSTMSQLFICSVINILKSMNLLNQKVVELKNADFLIFNSVATIVIFHFNLMQYNNTYRKFKKIFT